MAYCGSSTTTTTIDTKINKVAVGAPTADSGNDSLITNQDSATADELDGDVDMISGPSSSSAEAPNVKHASDGDVNSIFLCEFHPVAGPKITLQVPNDHVTKELFRIVHPYIIPKVPLQGSFLSM